MVLKTKTKKEKNAAPGAARRALPGAGRSAPLPPSPARPRGGSRCQRKKINKNGGGLVHGRVPGGPAGAPQAAAQPRRQPGAAALPRRHLPQSKRRGPPTPSGTRLSEAPAPRLKWRRAPGAEAAAGGVALMLPLPFSSRSAGTRSLSSVSVLRALLKHSTSRAGPCGGRARAPLSCVHQAEGLRDGEFMSQTTNRACLSCKTRSLRARDFLSPVIAPQGLEECSTSSAAELGVPRGDGDIRCWPLKCAARCVR